MKKILKQFLSLLIASVLSSCVTNFKNALPSQPDGSTVGVMSFLEDHGRFYYLSSYGQISRQVKDIDLSSWKVPDEIPERVMNTINHHERFKGVELAVDSDIAAALTTAGWNYQILEAELAKIDLNSLNVPILLIVRPIGTDGILDSRSVEGYGFLADSGDRAAVYFGAGFVVYDVASEKIQAVESAGISRYTEEHFKHPLPADKIEANETKYQECVKLYAERCSPFPKEIGYDLKTIDEMPIESQLFHWSLIEQGVYDAIERALLRAKLLR